MDQDQIDVEAADARSEKAKASLRSRLHELERRYESAKNKLDLGARIARNPRAAVGIAFGAGVLLGVLGGRGRRTGARADGTQGVGSAVIAALGAFAINALKDAALREGTEMAKGWWADRTERDASRDPAVEAFLDH
jgi:hypothetical protein